MPHWNSARDGRYRLYLLSYAAPGQPVRPVGVLLFDSHTETLHWRVNEQWDFITEEFDREYLSVLSADIGTKAQEMGGTALLAYLEDTLSNVLLLSELPANDTLNTDPVEATRAAYNRHVMTRITA
jgi:hypothetical protein